MDIEEDAVLYTNQQLQRGEEGRILQDADHKDLEFLDVIWTDECTIQLESHRIITYHRKGEPSRMCPRARHPYEVHVWGEISKWG